MIVNVVMNMYFLLPITLYSKVYYRNVYYGSRVYVYDGGDEGSNLASRVMTWGLIMIY